MALSVAYVIYRKRSKRERHGALRLSVSVIDEPHGRGSARNVKASSKQRVDDAGTLWASNAPATDAFGLPISSNLPPPAWAREGADDSFQTVSVGESFNTASFASATNTATNRNPTPSGEDSKDSGRSMFGSLLEMLENTREAPELRA